VDLSGVCNDSKTAAAAGGESGQQRASSGVSRRLDASESNRESGVVADSGTGGNFLSSWAHHSTPQMNAAAAAGPARSPYTDRRLQQLRDDDKDAMHRFK